MRSPSEVLGLGLQHIFFGGHHSIPDSEVQTWSPRASLSSAPEQNSGQMHRKSPKPTLLLSQDPPHRGAWPLLQPPLRRAAAPGPSASVGVCEPAATGHSDRTALEEHHLGPRSRAGVICTRSSRSHVPTCVLGENEAQALGGHVPLALMKGHLEAGTRDSPKLTSQI